MKVEIIFSSIRRPDALSAMLRCFKACKKPKDVQILAVIQAGKDYKDKVERELRKIFKKTRVIHLDEEGIDHTKLRKSSSGDTWKEDKLQIEKLRRMYRTYQDVVKYADKDADYYWMVQDDQPFPPNTYPHYRKMMKDAKADIVSGVSFSWRIQRGVNHNFWEIKSKGSGYEFPAKKVPKGTSSIVRIGATGLGNLLCKKKCVQNWKPAYDPKLNWGNDVNFFVNAQKKGYVTYGDWGHPIPHITNMPDGSVQVLGRIKKSLVPLIFGK